MIKRTLVACVALTAMIFLPSIVNAATYNLVGIADGGAFTALRLSDGTTANRNGSEADWDTVVGGGASGWGILEDNIVLVATAASGSNSIFPYFDSGSAWFGAHCSGFEYVKPVQPLQ